MAAQLNQAILSTVLYLPLLDSWLNNHINLEKYIFTGVRLESRRNEEHRAVPKTPSNAEWTQIIQKT